MKNRSEKHIVEDYDSIGSIRYGSDSSNRKQRSVEQKVHIQLSRTGLLVGGPQCCVRLMRADQ